VHVTDSKLPLALISLAVLKEGYNRKRMKAINIFCISIIYIAIDLNN